MTKVYLERDGDRYTIACKGHATGNPKLCAAVSCLVYTAAGWAHNAGGVELWVKRLDAGDALITFSGCGCETAFELAAVGFLQLERQNPEFLSVELREIE